MFAWMTSRLDYTAQHPAWRQFDPYGNPRGAAAASGTFPGNRAFLNDPVDASSGLTDIGARWYDSSTGSFVSLDPLLEKSSPAQLNGYTYAGENPVDGSDPTGELLFGGFSACQGGGCDEYGNKSGSTIGFSGGAPVLTPAADYPEPDFGSMCTMCSLVKGVGNGIANKLTDPGRILSSSMINMVPTGVSSNGIQFGDTTPDEMGGTNPFGTNDSGSAAYQLGYDIGPGLAAAVGGGESLGEELGDAGAASADAGEAATAQEGASAADPAGASAVNGAGGTHNCVACAIAGDRTLGGNPVGATNIFKGRPIPNGMSIIENYAGAPWRAVSGQAEISNELLQAGNGARGIVYGGNGIQAHVWNAVVQRGAVNYVDFQGIGPSGPASFDPWRIMQNPW